MGVGSNIDPADNIERALEQLDEFAPIVRVSNFYITQPLERPEQATYRNGAVRIEFARGPRALKFEVLRAIEEALGRKRGADRFAARTIDLDVVLYGDAVTDDGELALPHPDVFARAFVAAPLLDIEPALRIPGSGWASDLDCVKDAALEVDAELTQRLKERWNK